MNNRQMTRLALLSAFGMALAFIPVKSEALTFYFNEVLTSSGTPSGSDWATLELTDGGANTVNAVFTHNATSGDGQYISELLLNVNPFPNDIADNESSPKITDINYGLDGFTDVGTKYDIQILFETSNADGGINRLKPGESVSWSFTGTGLTVDHFNTFSNPNGENVAQLGMTHLQGLPDGGSAKLVPGDPVPEPASIAALAMGGLYFLRRRKK